MGKNKSKLIFGAAVVVFLAILFAWPKLNDPNRFTASLWKDSGVGCLPAHQNANQHIHSELKISVDGRDETIPANVGVVRGCMAELHTHDADGVIHIESVESGKIFTLEQFFTVFGQPLERGGFSLEMILDGASNQELGNLVLKDKQKIDLVYKKVK